MTVVLAALALAVVLVLFGITLVGVINWLVMSGKLCDIIWREYARFTGQKYDEDEDE